MKVPVGRHVDFTFEEGLDFFPTPAPFTQVLIDFFNEPGREPIKPVVWEPACGNGAMSKVFIFNGHSVFSSDIKDHGYGTSPVNFLDTYVIPYSRIGCVATNPPFKIAHLFVQHGWELMNEYSSIEKMCMLLPAHWFGSEYRYHDIFQVRRPQQLIIISDRMILPYREPKINNKGKLVYHYTYPFNHCWFVWDKTMDQSATLTDWRMWNR